MNTDYAVAQKVLHWLMALLIMLDLVVAQKFGNPMAAWDRLDSRSDHASLGTIVAVLFVIRVVLRLRHGAPPLNPQMTPWQARLAHWAHGLFYFLIGLLILSGVATALNAASPLPLFGVWDITIGQLNEETFGTLRPVHEFATNALIALIVLHLVAALYHQFVLRDTSTINMLKFWSSDRAPEQEA